MATLRLAAATTLYLKARAVLLALKVWCIKLGYLSDPSSLFGSRTLHWSQARDRPTSCQILSFLRLSKDRQWAFIILLVWLFYSNFYWILFHGHFFDQLAFRLNLLSSKLRISHSIDNSIWKGHQSGHRSQLAIARWHWRVLSYPLWCFCKRQCRCCCLLLSQLPSLCSSGHDIGFHLEPLSGAWNSWKRRGSTDRWWFGDDSSF